MPPKLAVALSPGDVLKCYKDIILDPALHSQVLKERNDVARKKKKNIIRRPYLKKVNRVKQNYKPEDVLAAMHAIWKGMSRRQAAKVFNIPRSTLLDKLDGKRPVDASPGPNPFLTKAEERLLEKWAVELYERGFPLKCEDLKDMAQSFIQNNQRRTSFKNGRPGRSWMRNFLLRHPHVCRIGADPARKGRSVTTREEVRLWCQQHRNLLASIGHEDILDDPQGNRIFNVDHGEFLFDVNTARFIEQERHEDNPKIQRTGVECVSVVANFSAAGRMAPLMFVYPMRELPDEVVETFPSDWVGTHSEKGVLTGKTFFDYIVAFHRWLIREKVELPVVLLLDGRRSRLNLDINKFCEDNGIILYCLFPTPRPAIAELFSAIFDGPNHESKFNGHVGRTLEITKYNFALRLKEALSIVDNDNSKNVFEVYGILPYLQNILQTLTEVKADVVSARDCEPDCETDCELTPIEGEIEMEFPIAQSWGTDPLASLNSMFKPTLAATSDLNASIAVTPPTSNYYMVQVGSNGCPALLKLPPQPAASPSTETDGISSKEAVLDAAVQGIKVPSNDDPLSDLNSQFSGEPVQSQAASVGDKIVTVDNEISEVLNSIISLESNQAGAVSVGSCPESPGSSNGSYAEPFLGFAVNPKSRELSNALTCLKSLKSFLSSKQLLSQFTEATQTRTWTGDNTYSMLFEFWLSVSDQCQAS